MNDVQRAAVLAARLVRRVQSVARVGERADDDADRNALPRARRRDVQLEE